MVVVAHGPICRAADQIHLSRGSDAEKDPGSSAYAEHEY